MGSGRDGWRLEAGSEWVARDPFGRVKASDASARVHCVCDESGRVLLRAARGGYASFRLWVIGAGEYRLSVEAAGGLEVDLFRAWYHRMAGEAEGEETAYCVDALVPVGPSAPQRLPDPDNAVEAQTQQEYWVDVFAPTDAAAGRREFTIVLTASGQRRQLPVLVDVLDAAVPDEDVIVCDHNSYGCAWLPAMYPGAFARCRDADDRSRTCIEILHNYHRLCREHRGLFSNLGAGHAGTFDRIYGPRTVGSGRDRRLADWGWFDRHYGPLLDGSAFAAASAGMPPARRPARPAWGVYTPINADWPADYLWWGQPGYDVEFGRCVGQFDRHFRDNGWTHTRPWFFFNHKKRYRWYEWDGDEPKYSADDAYVHRMGRLLRRAIDGSDVPWVYRMDASWQMARHFERLAGVVDFWVCGSFARWWPDEVRRVVERGDVVWTYSGTPGIAETSSALLEHVLRTWARGIHGHCEWLTTDPGEDPWFACTGAETGMLYPGGRFGLAGPLPSVRLKLQRNAVQDVNLLHARAAAAGRLDETRRRIAEQAGVVLWQPPPPVVRALPPEQWDSRNLAASQDDSMADHAELDPLWWLPVREAAASREGRP